MAFNFTAQWVEGNHNNRPDALSWNPIVNPTNEDMLVEYDIHNQQDMSTAEVRTISDTNFGNMHLKDLKYHVDQDQEYEQLKQLILQGSQNTRASSVSHVEDTGRPMNTLA